MAIESQPGQSARWLAIEFARRLSQAIESMAGDKRRSEATPTEGADLEAYLWWEQPLSIAGSASVFIGAVEEVWSGIGGAILTSAGLEISPDEAKNTYFETLAQAMLAVAQSVTVRLGSEAVCIRSQELSSPPEGLTQFFRVKAIGQADSAPAELLVGFSPELLAAFEVQPESARPFQYATATDAETPTGSAQTLDLLLDVELPVTVSFGRAQLLLKDVIKLTSGSIVELDRAVSEPVEVIVNNCVIARGEVVVIDGNYGVRICQIVSRQERLRTLR